MLADATIQYVPTVPRLPSAWFNNRVQIIPLVIQKMMILIQKYVDTYGSWLRFVKRRQDLLSWTLDA